MEELIPFKGRCSSELTVDMLLKPNTIGHYQMQRYLEEKSQAGISMFLASVDSCRQGSKETRAKLTKALLEEVKSTDQAASAAGETENLPGQPEPTARGSTAAPPPTTPKPQEKFGLWLQKRKAEAVAECEKNVAADPVAEAFDPAIAEIKAYFETILADFKAGEHFCRYVQLKDYASKELGLVTHALILTLDTFLFFPLFCLSLCTHDPSA